MPAEIVHALRQRLDHLDRRGARLDQVEADAADARSFMRLSSASATLVSTTATPRAVAPICAMASSVTRLSVP
jgi:hypothetical protein